MQSIYSWPALSFLADMTSDAQSTQIKKFAKSLKYLKNGQVC